MKLITGFHSIYKLMVQSAVKIFYLRLDTGLARKVSNCENPKLSFLVNNYNAKSRDGHDYLSSVEEAPLFAMMYLLSWELPADEKELMWVNYFDNIEDDESQGRTMKYLFMPYLDINIARRLYRTNEKTKTANAENNTLPGMFSLFLQNTSVASVWLHSHALRAKSQSLYGLLEDPESTFLDSKYKFTTLLAIIGGTADLTARQLLKEVKIEHFYEMVDREYNATIHIEGELDDFSLPKQVTPPCDCDEFTSCRL